MSKRGACTQATKNSGASWQIPSRPLQVPVFPERYPGCLFGSRASDARVAKEVFEYAYNLPIVKVAGFAGKPKKNHFDTTGPCRFVHIWLLQRLEGKAGCTKHSAHVIVPPDVKEQYAIYAEENGLKTSKYSITVRGYAGSVYDKGCMMAEPLMNGRRLTKSA